jgi:hypothetical protein
LTLKAGYPRVDVSLGRRVTIHALSRTIGPGATAKRRRSSLKGGSGVIVEVVVNDRSEHEQIYVQKKEKTFSPSPCS